MWLPSPVVLGNATLSLYPANCGDFCGQRVEQRGESRGGPVAIAALAARRKRGVGGQREICDHHELLGRTDSSPRPFCWLPRLLLEPQSLASRAKGLGIEDPSADAVLPRLARLSQAKARVASRIEMREGELLPSSIQNAVRPANTTRRLENLRPLKE